MGYSGYVYVNKDLILQLVACEIMISLILKRQEKVLSTTLLFLAEIFVSTRKCFLISFCMRKFPSVNTGPQSYTNKLLSSTQCNFSLDFSRKQNNKANLSRSLFRFFSKLLHFFILRIFEWKKNRRERSCKN